MGVFDVTSRDAVLDAIDECEDVGADAFIRQYGLGLPSELTVDYISRRFPAVAAINLAHRIMHGQLLDAAGLQDETAIRHQLASLGFTVHPPAAPGRRSPGRRGTASASSRPRSTAARRSAPSVATARSHPATFDLRPGDLRTRAELTVAYGGTKVGAVAESPRTNSLMIFADPTPAGPSAAVFDGWDRYEEGLYHVAAGRRGRDPATSPITRSAQSGRTLHLFESVDEPMRPGGKRQRYLGAFRVDADLPWQVETDHDQAGRARQVVVFRLRQHEGQTGPRADQAGSAAR
ncbi:MAG: hypothetical protein CSB46_06010 [Micrococcales bacterium]|nr:MAG: hypothetical protein CSB46_06010 [Micrococcales bacterium]